MSSNNEGPSHIHHKPIKVYLRSPWLCKETLPLVDGDVHGRDNASFLTNSNYCRYSWAVERSSLDRWNLQQIYASTNARLHWSPTLSSFFIFCHYMLPLWYVVKYILYFTYVTFDRGRHLQSWSLCHPWPGLQNTLCVCVFLSKKSHVQRPKNVTSRFCPKVTLISFRLPPAIWNEHVRLCRLNCFISFLTSEKRHWNDCRQMQLISFLGHKYITKQIFWRMEKYCFCFCKFAFWDFPGSKH